jgi:hypothetical protein
MRVLVRDYLAFNRKKVLSDLALVYGATVILATGILLQAWAQEKMIRRTLFVVLIIVLPIALVCLTHFVAIWLTGISLARSVGLSLRDYVKSDAYRQNGREVLRDLWGKR